MSANQRKSWKSYARQKRIISKLTPHPRMQILGGHLFGVMQLLGLREVDFKTAFGADRGYFFDGCVDMLEAGLSAPPSAADKYR